MVGLGRGLVRWVSVVVVFAVGAVVLALVPGGAVPLVGGDRRAGAVVDGLSTLAGSGSVGQVDGVGVGASFDTMIDMAADRRGTFLYVLEGGAQGRPNKVRKVNASTGSVSTLYSGGLLVSPTNIKVDGAGAVWVAVADGSGGAGIIKIDSSGTADLMLSNLRGYYGDGGGTGGAFAFSPNGADLYYMNRRNSEDWAQYLYSIPVGSLPADGHDGDLLGAGTESFWTRGAALDMSFASDGNLYFNWDGSSPSGGPGGAYSPQFYRYDGSTVSLLFQAARDRHRFVFTPNSSRMYLLCVAWYSCESGESTLVYQDSFGTDAPVKLAGGANGFADGSPGMLSGPVGLAVSPDGTKIWIADRDNHRVRVRGLPDDPSRKATVPTVR